MGRGRHLHLWAPFLPDGKLRGRHFSGLEGAQLWLRNSEAAFASWGAVFTWLGALGRFFILIGRMVVVEELRGGIHILGAPFSGSESLVGKLRGRHFFRFRGRLVVFDELRGGTCILGRRFYLFGSSEGGISSHS